MSLAGQGLAAVTAGEGLCSNTSGCVQAAMWGVLTLGEHAGALRTRRGQVRLETPVRPGL